MKEIMKKCKNCNHFAPDCFTSTCTNPNHPEFNNDFPKIVNADDKCSYWEELILSKEHKDLFERIVTSICELYEAGKHKADLDLLARELNKGDACAFFSWAGKDNDSMGLTFQYDGAYTGEGPSFWAQIDLTDGNTAPYTVLKWNNHITDLVDFINSTVPNVGKVIDIYPLEDMEE